MTEKDFNRAKDIQREIGLLESALDILQRNEYSCTFALAYQRKNTEVGHFLYESLPSTFNEKFIPFLEEELARLKREFEEL